MDDDLSKRIIVSRNFDKNNITLDFYVSDVDKSDGFEFLYFLKMGEELSVVQENANSLYNNTLAVYTYDVVKLGYVPQTIAPLLSKKIENSNKNSMKMKIKKINNRCTKKTIEVRSTIDLAL